MQKNITFHDLIRTESVQLESNPTAQAKDKISSSAADQSSLRHCNLKAKEVAMIYHYAGQYIK